MPAPQPQTSESTDGKQGSEDTAQSESQDKDVTRVITALATDISTRRFALGFDDGLYLWFDPVASPKASFEFIRQELRDTAKEVMTSAKMKELVNHTGAIIAGFFQ